MQHDPRAGPERCVKNNVDLETRPSDSVHPGRGRRLKEADMNIMLLNDRFPAA